MATTTTGIKLNDDIRQRLKNLARLRNRTPHWLMKTAILEYLEREEAYEREKQEDEARWQRYQTDGNNIRHEEMLEWMDELAESADKKART